MKKIQTAFMNIHSDFEQRITFLPGPAKLPSYFHYAVTLTTQQTRSRFAGFSGMDFSRREDSSINKEQGVQPIAFIGTYFLLR
jgi:hypothetical protein